ncbi:Peroxisomal membrane protein PMP27 [Coemansia erecta]|uniref:Peroxisomal membrane protein PMP27 n=1 Tax=Coemansia erecta TaxID=147472 RepID=A0A9W7XW19_9FUNG|nr:Peroxisomal membrane protein PMP27 [Coemansia erecta]
MDSAALHMALAAANSNATSLYVRYTGMLGGRDKLCRLAQYFSRLMVYVLSQRQLIHGKPSGTAAATSWLATFAKVQAAMGVTRKIMRAGKFVEFLQLLVRTLCVSGEDEVAKLLSAVHKAGMFVFMGADTLGLLAGPLALLRLRNAPRVARIGQRGWLVALVSQVLLAAYRLRNFAVREGDLRRVRRQVEKAGDAMGDRECAVEEQMVGRGKALARRQLVAAALDLTIPAKGLGLLVVNEGLVALAGTVTSCMGIQDVLAKAAASL